MTTHEYSGFDPAVIDPDAYPTIAAAALKVDDARSMLAAIALAQAHARLMESRRTVEILEHRLGIDRPATPHRPPTADDAIAAAISEVLGR